MSWITSPIRSWRQASFMRQRLAESFETALRHADGRAIANGRSVADALAAGNRAFIDGRTNNLGLTKTQGIDFGLVVRTPMIEITTIGAGGGSIASVDRGEIAALCEQVHQRACLGAFGDQESGIPVALVGQRVQIADVLDAVCDDRGLGERGVADGRRRVVGRERFELGFGAGSVGCRRRRVAGGRCRSRSCGWRRAGAALWRAGRT